MWVPKTQTAVTLVKGEATVGRLAGASFSPALRAKMIDFYGMTLSIPGYRAGTTLRADSAGLVLRAEQTSNGRAVELRLIAPPLASSPGFRERLLREANRAGSFHHPNLLPPYEVGEHDGVLVLATRAINAVSLERVLTQQGALAPQRVAAILRQAAAGLDSAHGRDLVHRDVNPGNVLVVADGDFDRVYVTGFGLTEVSEGSGLLDRDRLTAPPAYGYVAPEQIRGEAPDGRADVYSLGCVAFTALTGRPPFGDHPAKDLAGRLEGSPPSARALAAGMPEAVDTAIAKAMAVSPADRFPTAGEFAAAVVAGMESSSAAPQPAAAPAPSGPEATPTKPEPSDPQPTVPVLPKGPASEPANAPEVKPSEEPEAKPSEPPAVTPGPPPAPAPPVVVSSPKPSPAAGPPKPVPAPTAREPEPPSPVPEPKEAPAPSGESRPAGVKPAPPPPPTPPTADEPESTKQPAPRAPLRPFPPAPKPPAQRAEPTPPRPDPSSEPPASESRPPAPPASDGAAPPPKPSPAEGGPTPRRSLAEPRKEPPAEPPAPRAPKPPDVVPAPTNGGPGHTPRAPRAPLSNGSRAAAKPAAEETAGQGAAAKRRAEKDRLVKTWREMREKGTMAPGKEIQAPRPFKRPGSDAKRPGPPPPPAPAGDLPQKPTRQATVPPAPPSPPRPAKNKKRRRSLLGRKR